jgi:hypothetical protein
MRAQRGEDAKSHGWEERNENQAGGEPEPMGDGDSGGEEPCGVEQGDLTRFATQAIRSWTAKSLLGGGGTGLHRA